MIDDKLIIPEFLKTKLKSLGFWFAVLLLLYLVGTLIPEGFDWRHFFSKGLVSPIWTPRVSIVLRSIHFPTSGRANFVRNHNPNIQVQSISFANVVSYSLASPSAF